MKRLLTLLLLLSFFSLSAQEKKNGSQRTCRALFVHKPADSPDAVFIFDGKSSRQMYLSGKSFSSPMELPSGLLKIYFSSTEVDLTEELPPGMPSLTIPENVTDLYLLASSDPSNEHLPIRFQAINVNDNVLKPGETLWLNLSKHSVVAKLGDHQISIPPMKQAVSPAPLRDNGYYPAKFIYRHNGEGEYRMALNKTWRFQKNSKILGFIIDTGGRRPEIFTVRDRRISQVPSAAE